MHLERWLWIDSVGTGGPEKITNEGDVGIFSGVQDQPRDRQTEIRNAVLAADQVIRDKRPVRPRQGMVVKRVHLAKRAAQLADLHQQPTGQRREADEPFLDLHTFGTKRQEEIGARSTGACWRAPNW